MGEVISFPRRDRVCTFGQRADSDEGRGAHDSLFRSLIAFGLSLNVCCSMSHRNNISLLNLTSTVCVSVFVRLAPSVPATLLASRNHGLPASRILD